MLGLCGRWHVMPETTLSTSKGWYDSSPSKVLFACSWPKVDQIFCTSFTYEVADLSPLHFVNKARDLNTVLVSRVWLCTWCTRLISFWVVVLWVVTRVGVTIWLSFWWTDAVPRKQRIDSGGEKRADWELVAEICPRRAFYERPPGIRGGNERRIPIMGHLDWAGDSLFCSWERFGSLNLGFTWF